MSMEDARIGDRAGDQAAHELQEVETKDIGFQDVASQPGARLQVSQPWPEDRMPLTTASLLSIASGKGILAAAGPDSLIIVSTEKARHQYLARRKDDDEQDLIRDLVPDVRLSVPRVSHVAFSSDESCLVIAAQQGGGLAVYDTNQLSNGAQPAFQIATNNTGVRHLLPNPSPLPELAHLFGIILDNGKLLLADLKNKTLRNKEGGGPVHLENVSSAAWSKLGKQIIAGLADSTAVRIDPKGVVQDTIPRPPQLEQLQSDYQGAQALPITSISWLSTYEFLIIFSPIYPGGESGGMLDSIYFIARRTKQTPFTFQKFDRDPCTPFGMQERTPSHHFLLRFTEWLNIVDMVAVGSTSSTDINFLAHFKPNADKGYPDDFVTANIPDDRAQRAIVPYNNALNSDTSPVGMAIDLSSRELAPRPVYNEADSYPHSTIPLPALCVLNLDGTLSMWWVLYNDAIKQKVVYPNMVHKTGRFAKYKKFNKAQLDIDLNNPHAHEQDLDVSDDEVEMGGGPNNVAPAPNGPFSSNTLGAFSGSPFGSGSSTPAATQASQSTFGQSGFAQTPKPAFGQNSMLGFGASSQLGHKASPWETPKSASSAVPPSVNPFAQPSSLFGQASTPSQGLGFGKPSLPGSLSGFGQVSQLGGGSPFGKPSTPGATSGIGQPSPLGGGWSSSKPSTPGATPAFGQPSQPAGFGKPSTPGATPTPGFGQPSQMGGNAGFGKPLTPGAGSAFGQPSKPFGNFGSTTPAAGSLFGSGSTASPFLSLGSNGSSKKENPFAAAAQQKPAFSKETSTGSTATLGSTTSSSFGTGSSFPGSSFISKPAMSQESTMKDDDDSVRPSPSGFGLGAGGFKLGSGFKSDGTAKDDGPKPANPGAGMFGLGFGNALNSATKKEPEPAKPATQQPGQAAQPAHNQAETPKSVLEDAPLPPDPISSKGLQVADDAPLPPDPSTYKAPKMPDDLPPPFGQDKSKETEKDVPIAGSPPIDVTNSQTFSSAGGSEAAGPPEDEESWEDEEADDGEGESEEEEEEEGEEEEGEEEEEEGDEDEEEEEADEEVRIEDPPGLNAFMKRISPPSPKKTNHEESQRTPQSDEKTEKSSYTPAGFPKVPSFPPPASRTILSPRSPSPQRAVTSPIPRGVPQNLPPQIKMSAVPPAVPILRPTAPPNPKQPSEFELQDEADAKVKAYIAGPPEPTKELPKFFSHADYEGTVERSGIGGQIEKVFRDVNSMVDVVGLNAKVLHNFLLGHEAKNGQRTIEDLDKDDVWLLGDMADLKRVMGEIGKRLEDGKLDGVRDKTEALVEEQKEMLRVKSKTIDVRKQVSAHVDPDKLALQEVSPLSAETQAQQMELRRRVQRVQKLLSDVEQKMTMLRADLASVSSKDAESSDRPPVPTVEAVTNTILRMTSMVQQKSGDIDVLEAQIRRLPNGLASLHLDGDYEDDLASRLAGNLANSPVKTPPRRARMAANGDPLGMSGMFGRSRFETPPSASVRFTPGASGLGRSAGSLGGSVRKKMVDVTAEEIDTYYAKVQRRKTVLDSLKDGIGKSGVKVVRIG